MALRATRRKPRSKPSVREIKVGTVYTGKVVSTKDFGAFIELAPGTDGMCHISELAEGYVKNVEDIVKIGDTIKVKVIQVDETGRIKLSRKALIAEGEVNDGKPLRVEGDGGRGAGGGGGGGGRRDGGGGKQRSRGGRPDKPRNPVST
jgi:polyribonucleotide nucleotidyltransferase